MSNHFARQYNPTPSVLVASVIRPAPHLLYPGTFPWVAELYLRCKMTHDLDHNFVSMEFDSMLRNQIGITVYQTYIYQGIKDVRHRLINILFRISDARRNNHPHGKNRQENYVRSMDKLDMGCLAYVLASEGSSLCRGGREGPFLLNQVTATDREHNCVVRELTLRYGPYFLWAKHGSARERLWVRKMIARGVQELKDYEAMQTANRRSFQSLQSSLFRAFCRNEGCDILDCWEFAFATYTAEVKRIGKTLQQRSFQLDLSL